MLSWMYTALALVCAASAFLLSSGKSRSVLSWTFSCFSLPLLLPLLYLLPTRGDDEPETGYLVLGGMGCAAVCTVWSAISLLGGSITGTHGLPACNSPGAHGMVSERWMMEHVLQGGMPIATFSGDHEISTGENTDARECEADAMTLDGNPIHVRYRMISPPGGGTHLDMLVRDR